MQVTERDKRILKWINSHGYVSVMHVMAKFGMSRNAAYRRLCKLRKGEFIAHKKFSQYEHGAYYVTPMGVAFVQDRISAIRKICYANFNHQLAVVNASIILEHATSGQFISERVLRHQRGFQGKGRRTHLCDGELHIDKRRIAIEVELTSKAKSRLDNIFKYYLSNLDYDEVWYICGNKSVQRIIEPYKQKAKFIKTYDYKELLSGNAKTL